MFTDYYKLLNIFPESSTEEINSAIEECKLPKSLIDEIKMVLLNKSLKVLYDTELHIYESSESKKDYIISNPILDRELKKIGTYLSNKPCKSIEYKEDSKNRRFWIGVFVFFLIISLKMCMSSCTSNSNNKLGDNVVVDAITTLKQELPFRMEGLGKVREIDYEGNTVLFQLWIQEDDANGMDVSKMNYKKSLAKEIVATQIGMMSDHMKDAIKKIAEQSFGLQVIVNGSDFNQGIIELTPDEIGIALSNIPYKTQNDFSLGMVAQTTRLLLPMEVDEITTWIDTKMTDSTFEYIYRLDDNGIDLNRIDLNLLKNEKLTTFRQNMDVLGNVVELCKTTRRNIICRYIDNRSNKTIDVVLTPSELEKNNDNEYK